MVDTLCYSPCILHREAGPKTKLFPRCVVLYSVARRIQLILMICYQLKGTSSVLRFTTIGRIIILANHHFLERIFPNRRVASSKESDQTVVSSIIPPPRPSLAISIIDYICIPYNQIIFDFLCVVNKLICISFLII